MRNAINAALFTSTGFAITFSSTFVAGMVAMVRAAGLI